MSKTYTDQDIDQALDQVFNKYGKNSASSNVEVPFFACIFYILDLLKVDRGNSPYVTSIEYQRAEAYVRGYLWSKVALRELHQNNPYGFLKRSKQTESAIAKQAGIAINDYVCPTCDNNRCSKSEITCWRCGNRL